MNNFLGKLALWDRQFSSSPLIFYGVFFSIIVFFVAFYVFLSPFDIIRQPDSQGYEQWSPLRRPLYGAFISLLKSLNLFVYLPHIQFGLFFLAVFFLACESCKTANSIVAGAGVMIATYANTELAKYTNYLLSEGLYYPLAISFVALVLRISRHHNEINYGCLGICLGLMFVTKTISAVFIIAALILFILRRSKFKHLRYFVFGLIFVIALGSLYSQQEKKSQEALGQQITQNYDYAGLLLMAKIAPVPARNTQNKFPATTEMFERIMAGPQEAFRQIASMKHLFMFSTSFYDYLFRRHLADMERAVIEDGGRPNGAGFKEFSILVISQNPIEYIKDVHRNFWAGWFLWDLQTHEEIAVYNQLVAGFENYIPEDKKISQRRSFSKWMVIPIRGFLYLSFLAGTLVTITVFYKALFNKPISSILLALSIAYMSMVGYFVVVAMFAPGIPRYAFVTWSLHALIVMGAIVQMRDFLVGYLRNGPSEKTEHWTNH